MPRRNPITRRNLMAAAAAILPSVLAMPARAAGKVQTLGGQVVYRERIALPPGTVTTVELLDVSRADAMADRIAVQDIPGATASPIPYELHFDPSVLQQGHTYALRAQITLDGQLLFTTTTHHPALDGGPGDGTIQVQMIARHTAETGADTPLLTGNWLAEDIAGGGVIDNLQSVLSIAQDGAVSGSGGCNRFFGKAVITADTISFGGLGVTMMACPPAIMDQEQKFLRALAEARRFQIQPQQDKLLLFNDSGAEILRLARTTP